MQANQSMLYSHSTADTFSIHHVGTDEITLSRSAKYLGIILDSKLNWIVHISEEKAIVNEKLRKLYWILNKKSPINLETKCLI